MDTKNNGSLYKIWGADQTVYGPVELPTLVEWIQDERVTADTWLYHPETDHWRKAADLPELKMFFSAHVAMPATTGEIIPGLTPGALRRIKILASLSDSQIARFVQLTEILRVNAWQEIVKHGEMGDAMFLILAGELRVRLMVGGKETTIATLQSGDFFGEISLLDAGPRSADVIAHRESILLKITAQTFSQMVINAPDLAAPFLFSIGKTMTARIRADNRRYRDSLTFSRTPRSEAKP